MVIKILSRISRQFLRESIPANLAPLKHVNFKARKAIIRSKRRGVTKRCLLNLKKTLLEKAEGYHSKEGRKKKNCLRRLREVKGGLGRGKLSQKLSSKLFSKPLSKESKACLGRAKKGLQSKGWEVREVQGEQSSPGKRDSKAKVGRSERFALSKPPLTCDLQSKGWEVRVRAFSKEILDKAGLQQSRVRSRYVKGSFPNRILPRIGVISPLSNLEAGFKKKADSKKASRERFALSKPFKLQLKEKTKVSLLYGNLSKKELLACFQKSKAYRGGVGYNLLLTLEKRLDVLLYRVGFFKTILSARQWISHGRILINGQVITFPRYQVQVGDVFSVSLPYRRWVRDEMVSRWKLSPTPAYRPLPAKQSLGGQRANPREQTSLGSALSKPYLPRRGREAKALADFFSPFKSSGKRNPFFPFTLKKKILTCPPTSREKFRFREVKGGLGRGLGRGKLSRKTYLESKGWEVREVQGEGSREREAGRASLSLNLPKPPGFALRPPKGRLGVPFSLSSQLPLNLSKPFESVLPKLHPRPVPLKIAVNTPNFNATKFFELRSHLTSLQWGISRILFDWKPPQIPEGFFSQGRYFLFPEKKDLFFKRKKGLQRFRERFTGLERGSRREQTKLREVKGEGRRDSQAKVGRSERFALPKPPLTRESFAFRESFALPKPEPLNLNLLTSRSSALSRDHFLPFRKRGKVLPLSSFAGLREKGFISPCFLKNNYYFVCDPLYYLKLKKILGRWKLLTPKEKRFKPAFSPSQHNFSRKWLQRKRGKGISSQTPLFTGKWDLVLKNRFKKRFKSSSALSKNSKRGFYKAGDFVVTKPLYDKYGREWFQPKRGVAGMKPLQVEVSYRTLTGIYLYSPQKMTLPASVNITTLKRSL